MGFRGIYEDKSSVSKTGIFCLLIFVSVILHYFLALTLLLVFTDNGINLIQNQDLSNQASVDYLKFIQIFSGLGLFITPTLLYAYLTNFDFKFSIMTRQSIILVIAIMILITPFIGMLLEWNMMIPFPDWLLKYDLNSGAVVDAFLQMSSNKMCFFQSLCAENAQLYVFLSSCVDKNNNSCAFSATCVVKMHNCMLFSFLR